MQIKKVVIPVAGWGTRSLPASKSVPKAMLSVYDRPVIHYIAAEAVQAGIDQAVFITSRGKSAIEDYFDYDPELEALLEKKGKTEMLAKVREASKMFTSVTSVRQREQLGLGHAVFCARRAVNCEPFAVMLGDDIMDGGENGKNGLPQLVEAASRYKKSVIGVMEVPEDHVNRYGIVEGEEIAPGEYRVTKLVEKPAVGTVKSRLAIVGRYVLMPGIFHCLEHTKAGSGGEIQLTDALSELNEREGMIAVKMQGLRFDTGNPDDWMLANLFFSLRESPQREKLLEQMRELVRSKSLNLSC